MFNFLWKKAKQASIKPVALLILDGWGEAPKSTGNATSFAKTPNIDKLKSLYPYSTLIASGESVGLPANEVGNTEVGHLTMGAGRVILQDLKKINTAISDYTFFENDAFLKAVKHTRLNNSKLHIVGLVGSGKVHSSTEHLYALLQFCKIQSLNNVCLHLFTDGRDSPPTQALEIITQIEQRVKQLGIGTIATVTGRYFAMDRDCRWERTEKAYRAIAEGVGRYAPSISQCIKTDYASMVTDEFIEPTIFSKNGNVESGDAMIFFNFRIDRPRQITLPFVLPNFESITTMKFGYVSDVEKTVEDISFKSTFTRNKHLANLFIVTMTQYQKDIPVNQVAFPPTQVEMSLSEVISKYNLRQMHLSESEKERFVSYYFDGIRENPFPGEETMVIPSPRVATYDKKPEMSLPKLFSEFKKALRRDHYHFFVINIANADMVAHSGNIKATIKALEFTDSMLGKFIKEILDLNGFAVITADHGNAEELLTFPTKSFFFTTSEGSVNTDHSNNPVPLIIVGKGFEGKSSSLLSGSLADIAPTILAIMNIPKPTQMSGKSLIK